MAYGYSKTEAPAAPETSKPSAKQTDAAPKQQQPCPEEQVLWPTEATHDRRNNPKGGY
jgi:hypothetical protein